MIRHFGHKDDVYVTVGVTAPGMVIGFRTPHMCPTRPIAGWHTEEAGRIAQAVIAGTIPPSAVADWAAANVGTAQGRSYESAEHWRTSAAELAVAFSAL